MRLGILQTGHVSEALTGKHGDYPPMFERMLRALDPSIRCPYWVVVDGDFPDSPEICDAWLVTGSKHGVYDPHPWIARLEGFLRDARAARVPVIGVCFGHQVMAQAYGGRAAKSEKGWGVGVHEYTLLARPGWMGGARERMAWHAMHQDQVTAVPGDATVLARSDFCEYAMLAYGDPEAPEAISIQAHPEFGTDYARDLLARRAAETVPAPVAETAFASFGSPVDNETFARWALAYLRGRLSQAA